MDFPGVNTVVNYDFPRSTADYVHRVGRTGRAGCKGDAVTFFTEEDSGGLRGVANLVKGAGGEVADWMLTLKKERRRREKGGEGAAAVTVEAGWVKKERKVGAGAAGKKNGTAAGKERDSGREKEGVSAAKGRKEGGKPRVKKG
jgi:superfamily II DNA/RNA helicase